jgi:hypothetical protein
MGKVTGLNALTFLALIPAMAGVLLGVSESKDPLRLGWLGKSYYVELDPLPVIHSLLTVVEPILLEWDMFEKAASIQSPAKCKVRSVIRFVKDKG